MVENNSATLTDTIVIIRQMIKISPVKVNGFSVCIHSRCLPIGMRTILNRKIAIIIAIAFFIIVLLMVIKFFKDCVDDNKR